MAQAQEAFEAEDYDRAIELYRQVVALEPTQVRAWARLGLILSWQDRLDEAVEAYRRALELEPDDPDLHLELARTLSWQGETDLALAEYEKVLALRPGDLQARLGMARALSWDDRTGEAVALYREILADHPEQAEAHLGLGQVRSWQGMDREALEHLERAVELAPDDREARHLLHNLELEHRPTLEPHFRTSSDTDSNRLDTVGATVSFDLEPQTRMRATWRNDSAENRTMGLTGGAQTVELGLRSRLSPELAVRARGGVVTLRPGPSASSSQAVGGGGVTWSPTPRDTVAADYAHDVLVDTPQLIGNSIALDEVTFAYGRRLPEDNRLDVSYSRGTFSDRNTREAIGASFFHEFRREPSVRLGVVHRQVMYERRSFNGYFSPPRFNSTQLVVAVDNYDLDDPWVYSLWAGGGYQKIDTERAQFVHRVAASLGYRITEDALVEVGGETTNSAASSVTGYGYDAAWVRMLFRF